MLYILPGTGVSVWDMDSYCNCNIFGARSISGNELFSTWSDNRWCSHVVTEHIHSYRPIRNWLKSGSGKWGLWLRGQEQVVHFPKLPDLYIATVAEATELIQIRNAVLESSISHHFRAKTATNVM
jgi:hypothetical protein